MEIGAAYQLIYKVGLDSLPQLRHAIIQALLDTELEKTPEIAAAVHHPTTTTRRSLEDLHCYHILDRQPGHTDRWRLTDLARELWKGAKSFPKYGGGAGGLSLFNTHSHVSVSISGTSYVEPEEILDDDG